MNETCDACGAQLVSHHYWRRMTDDQRREHRQRGLRCKARAGECHTCKMRRRRADEDALTTSLAGPYSRAEVLEEWGMLVDYSVTLHENCVRIAPRLGMRAHALEKALGRAGVRAWQTA